MQGRRQFVIMPAKFNDKAVEIIMLWFKNLMVYRRCVQKRWKNS